MNIRLFVAVPIAALTLFSCSKDSENLEQQVNTRKTAVTDYLDDFYDDPYTYGTPITTEDENGVEFSFKAITVDGEERGYLATNTAGTVSYFADVDRTNHILTSYDFQSGEEEEILDIDEEPEYTSTGSLNFVGIVVDVNSGAGARRKFVGYGKPVYNGPCNNGFQSGYTPYYFFWFEIKGKSGTPPMRPC
jgi:hypothetical protein